MAGAAPPVDPRAGAHTAPNGPTERLGRAGGIRWWWWRRRGRWLRWPLVAVGVVLAARAVAGRGGELARAGRLLAHPRPAWVGLAVLFEAGSMVVFARLQRWLLRCGGVRLSLAAMVEITLAANALSLSLPAGVAWSGFWAFGQLRRRGADRALAGWVILVAGAVASYALFCLLVVGTWAAGESGPLAPARWPVTALAAAPLLAALAATARHLGPRRPPQPGGTSRWTRPGPLGRSPGALARRLRLVRPGFRGWAEAGGLGLLNWIYDAACLAACVAAVGQRIPWRGLLVAYALAQVAASLPITPGGLGVVEASLAALLVTYGMSGPGALAAVAAYRIISFWAVVPLGWASWVFVERTGRRPGPDAEQWGSIPT